MSPERARAGPVPAGRDEEGSLAGRRLFPVRAEESPGHPQAAGSLPRPPPFPGAFCLCSPRPEGDPARWEAAKAVPNGLWTCRVFVPQESFGPGFFPPTHPTPNFKHGKRFKQTECIKQIEMIIIIKKKKTAVLIWELGGRTCTLWFWRCRNLQEATRAPWNSLKTTGLDQKTPCAQSKMSVGIKVDRQGWKSMFLTLSGLALF